MKDELRHLAPIEIDTLLANGDFDKFIGINESNNLEAKSSFPYDLTTGGTKSIMSLCSDIASMANNKEMYILCGLKCNKNSEVPHDIISELDLIEKNPFLNTYKHIPTIVNSNVHPKIEGIEVKWYPYAKNENIGLGVIHIPEQKDEKKWFILDIHGELSEYVGETFFGIPIRVGEDKNWKDKKEVYKLTKNSPKDIKDLYDSMNEQFTQLKIQLSSLEKLNTLDPADELSKTIEETLNEN